MMIPPSIGRRLRWLYIVFIAVSASVLFSYYIFPSQSSILTVTFISVALTPHLYRYFSAEESLAARRAGSDFLCRYRGVFLTMLSIAIALLLSFSFWYAVLPSDPVYGGGRCSTDLPCRESVFSLQTQYASERSHEAALALMLFAFALSLFLGAGAILIISWDVSALVASSLGSPGAFLLYLPQLLAFFLTGLAGALLSFAVIRHEWRSRGFFKVIGDSVKLMLLALMLALMPLLL